MPWVEMYWNPDAITDDLLKRIISMLPSVIARAFDVPDDPDGRLTVDDIEIKTDEFNDFDKYSNPLNIIIRTEDYEARRANLRERIRSVKAAIKEMLPENIHGFVWVRPVEGAFEEF